MGTARPWLLVAGLAASVVQGESGDLQTGRYTVLAPVATAAQADPLQSVVRLEFPRGLSGVTTVEAAVVRALTRSGYRLASREASDPALDVLLSQPLPEVQRDLGPITVEHALLTLAGPAWGLVVDRLHRLVSFEAVPPYGAYRPSAFVSDMSTPAEPVPLTPRPVTAALPVQSHTLRKAPRSTSLRDEQDRRTPVDPTSTKRYGPVRRGQVLSEIAGELRRAPSGHRAQVMVALYRENPEAFYHANMNNLKEGSTLRVPAPEAIAATGRWEATAEVRRQNEAWRGGRK